MILAIVGEGCLGAAIVRAVEASGEQVVTAAATDDHLFEKAGGCHTVVYAPSARLLEGTLEPAPDAERARTVLSACNAPGVQQLVMVRPAHDAWSAEDAVVKRSGKPYLIVRSTPLLEEIATAAQLEAMRSVSVPRDGKARATVAAAVAEAVVTGLADEDMQGRTVDAVADVFDAAELMRRAAATVGREIEVAPASPTGMKIRRALARVFGRPQRSAHELIERLGAT